MRKLAAVGLLLAVFLSSQGTAGAAVQGIALSPSLHEITLAKDQPSASFQVDLANTTDATVDLSLSTIDFGSLDESGGIAFLGKTGQETLQYGLKQWMVLEKDRLTLGPNESQTVKVTIENKESLGPGGHYGAVIVSGANKPGEGTDDVSVLPAASTLVFLNKSGGETKQLKLDSQKANKSWFSLPGSVMLRFKNSGNTHVVPRGTVELFSPTGNRLGRSVINQNSAYVLPGSFRQYEQDLRQNSQPWLPGRYRLVTTWRYDGQEESSVVTTHVWYMGKLLLYGLILLSLVIVLFVFIRYRRRPTVRGR